MPVQLVLHVWVCLLERLLGVVDVHVLVVRVLNGFIRHDLGRRPQLLVRVDCHAVESGGLAAASQGGDWTGFVGIKRG